MFEAAELGRKLSKKEFSEQEIELRNGLLEVQQDLREAKFPVLLLVNGVDAGGKGETVNLLLEWMDPRFVEANAPGALSDEERERPYFWRFWRMLPAPGRIGVFNGSWYSEPIVRRVYGQMKRAEFERRVQEMISFERMQYLNGALIVKVWLHLSKKAQKRRLESLASKKLTRWRVSEADWKHYRLYDDFVGVCDELLRRTSTGWAPWHMVEAEDARYRGATVARLLLESLRARLATPKPKSPATTDLPPATRTGRSGLLASLDLGQTLAKKDYETRLARLQGRLSLLARRAADEKVSTVIVFEGNDAAGKGGAIRRLVAGIDARHYGVVPIAAPSDEERQQSYLWRFWRRIPRDGRMTLFDRSWYGRLLVERIEKFCKQDDWRRAYGEINDFEEQLVGHGIVVVKFWLAISSEEQLERFEARKQIAYKRFKITEEDWRNREKWDEYSSAVDEMVERTSTRIAPWTLVEANCKYHARVKVLDTVCDALKRRLK